MSFTRFVVHVYTGTCIYRYLYIQPSSWRWTLGFETYRRHQKL